MPVQIKLNIIKTDTQKVVAKASSTSHRKQTRFHQNVTASLALTASQAEKLEEFKKQKSVSKSGQDINAIYKSIELVQNNIEEHAARRVDLFFYLLVAVYNTKMIISKAKTNKEHGKGTTKTGTHACHSSLFPNILMQNPDKNLRSSNKTDVTLEGTFLLESLNSTVELPAVVNGFDGHLEGRNKPTQLVTSAQQILNKVSNKDIDPRQGMNLFFKELDNFLKKPHHNYFKRSSKTSPAIVKTQVLKYQSNGSFFAAKTDTLTVKESYLHLMLRLKPEEIKAVEEKPELMDEYYKRMQKEIFSPKL